MGVTRWVKWMGWGGSGGGSVGGVEEGVMLMLGKVLRTR